MPRSVSSHFLVLLLTLVLLTLASSVCAEETARQSPPPLHQRVDQLILAGKGQHEVADRCSDSTFVRRVYLDFAGRIPTVDEVRSFLSDKAKNKRAALIDRLLQSADYVRRMQRLFHVMLMERRGDDKEWQVFLESCFQNNKPWDQMVRELLHPDAEDKALRGGAFFYTKRLEKYGQNPTDYPGLTRDVARLLLGQDLQCAQCHDHLFIKDYRQLDFQGLYSVYLNVGIDRQKKFPAVTEKGITKPLDFVSVFDDTPQQTAPRLPTGKAAKLPVSEGGKQPKKAGKKPGKKPDKKAKQPTATAAFSGLAWLARELPSGENKLFPRNIVNRLWFVMMGRGLVWPLDLHHAENPPSHPELLDLLAHEFASHQFDIKWLLRQLALSDTYQRSSKLVGKPSPADRFLVAQQRRLSAETLADNILQATGPWPSAKMKASKTVAEGETKDADSDPPEEFRKSLIEAVSNPPREAEVDIRSTVKGALYLSNSDQFLSLLRPLKGNLVSRLANMKDNNKLCEELFLCVLSRSPSTAETREVAQFLATRAENRSKAIGDVTWALICSMEFYVNH